MLPDLPELKRDMSSTLNRFLVQRVKFHSEFIGEIAHHSILEGEKNVIVRPNGEEDPTEIVKAEHDIIFKRSETASLDLSTVLKRLDEMAKEIAKQETKHFFKVLEKTTQKVGNVVDGKGRPLTPEMILEMLKKVEIDFDISGQIKNMSFVVPPSQQKKVQEIFDKFESDPELRKKHRQLLEEKREQWRVREAARTLVG